MAGFAHAIAKNKLKLVKERFLANLLVENFWTSAQIWLVRSQMIYAASRLVTDRQTD
jgi:hypothetical protein